MSESIENILRSFVEREIRIIERLKTISDNIYLKYDEFNRVLFKEKIENEAIIEAQRGLYKVITDLDIFIREADFNRNK